MVFMTTPYVTGETKYGKIRMHAVNGSRVMVDVGDETGHAHINDDRPALVYRGQEYIGSVFFDATVTDGLSATDVSISRRPEWSSAPKTYAAAMVEAMRETVSAYIAEHPEFLPAAEYAEVNNKLDSVTEERDKLAAELAEVENLAGILRERLANAPGYVCKSCNGPSPIGVGYVDSTPGASARSAGLTACECGKSVKP